MAWTYPCSSIPDLLIGAPNADPTGSYFGASYVVFGEPPPPRTCNGLPVTIRGTDNGEILNGTSANDVIDGQGGNDVLRDALNGGQGRDRCDGGGGTDTARRCEARVRIP